MRLRAVALTMLAAWLARAAPTLAQDHQPSSMISVDVDVLGASVGFLHAQAPGRYLGLEAGIGGSFLSRMLLSGRHFADAAGPSYESRDGSEDKELFEVLHAGLFRRWVRSEHTSVDAGARASVFVHFDSSDDDPGVPLFLGGYANFMVGGRHVKVGPRLLVGLFWERSLSGEFGIYLVPLSGRITFGW